MPRTAPVRTVPASRKPIGASSTPETPAWLQMPPLYNGTLPEFAVEWALRQLKVEFEKYLSGEKDDFFLPAYNTILRVQGIYWHYQSGHAKLGNDLVEKTMLEGRGFTVIDIDEDHCEENPLYYVKEALKGQDHSRASRGVL